MVLSRFFDRLMDWITLGWWSRHQGEQRIAIYGDKE
jgi:hypothetical protein